jgi:hypothetical protein
MHGPETMQDFRRERDAEATALVDGIVLEGLAGSCKLAAGQGISLDSVPGRQLRRRIGGSAV